MKRTNLMVLASVMILSVGCAQVSKTDLDPTAGLTTSQTQESGSIPCSGMPTSANQEGPYYSPGSPERASLIEDGMPGRPIMILGQVYDQGCQPIPDVKVDFWQADASGEYVNVGYRLRGHVITDANGFYSLETIEPGLYTGRPPHIHVKVFAPDGEELLTTQIYFPGSEGSVDVKAALDLLVDYPESDLEGSTQVWFNFIIQK